MSLTNVETIHQMSEDRLVQKRPAITVEPETKRSTIGSVAEAMCRVVRINLPTKGAIIWRFMDWPKQRGQDIRVEIEQNLK